MSINQLNPSRSNENHATLDYGEHLIDTRFNVQLTFKNPSHPNDLMKKTYEGRAMLTSKRVIFVTKDNGSKVRDFVMPFSSITNWELKQPIFGQNYIASTIKARPDGQFSVFLLVLVCIRLLGGWEGQVTINLTFNHGGACEFGQLVLRTASSASQPQQQTHQHQYPAPPPSYTPPVAGQMNPMTGFYEFPGQSQQPPPPQADAPPAYDSLQHSQGYGVTDRIPDKNQ